MGNVCLFTARNSTFCDRAREHVTNPPRHGHQIDASICNHAIDVSIDRCKKLIVIATAVAARRD